MRRSDHSSLLLQGNKSVKQVYYYWEQPLWRGTSRRDQPGVEIGFRFKVRD